MTIPTTNVSLASIQTEFGGSNPVGLSEYYRGGVYVPSGTLTSGVDGTAISTSGLIRVGMFRDVTTPGQTGIFPGSSITVLHIGVDIIISLGVTWQPDGVFDPFRGAGGSGQTIPTIGNWYSPTTPGIGNSYWIRASNATIVGYYTGMTVNTWLPLTSNRSVSWAVTEGQTGYLEGEITVEIAANATGSIVVAEYLVEFAFERAL